MFSHIDVKVFLISLIVLVLSVTLHEFGHAISADRLGDPGPRRDGRITLWPDKHFDLFGFLMMVVTLLANFGLGWGKPVMVDPRFFRKPRQGMMITAAFGPLMNLLLALFFGLILRFSYMTGHTAWMADSAQGTYSTLFQFVYAFLSINLALMFFNLIPIHPLDGSKILSGLLPHDLSIRYDRTVGQFGPLFLLAVFFFGGRFLGVILGPAVDHAIQLIAGVA